MEPQPPGAATLASKDMRRRLAQRVPFYYGWIIVVGAFLGTFIGGGLQSFTFSVFLQPMSEDLGWSRTVLTGALTFRLITAASLAPIFGPMVDKYGPRFLMVGAAIVGGVAAVLLSRVTEVWHFYAIFAFIGMSGGAGLGGVVTGATVVKWFVRRRGRAMAFTTMGGAAPGLILAPVIAFIVFNYSWQAGWLVMGVLFATILLPVSFFMARQPEDLGLLPDGAKSEAEVDAAYRRRGGLESAYSWRLKEVMRTSAFWLLIVGFVLGSLSISSVILHEISYVLDQGYSEFIATAVLTTHAGFALSIRPIWGLVLERVPVRFVVAAVYLGSSTALIILLTANTTAQFFLFAAVYGMSIAGHAVSQAIIFANYFGRDYAGTIRGVVTPITAGAGAIGPLLVSIGFDETGGYQMPFTVMIGLFWVGVVIMLLAKPPLRKEPLA